MARPKKKGLDYLPLDNDIFENEKLFDVQNEYGPLGEVIYIRLLCLINKNGYYYQFKNLDTLAAMMIRSIGNRWARDKKTVKDVILYLAKINLFSEELMQRNVITSRGVQERYLKAVERRQSQIEEYNLLEKSDLQEGLLSAPKKPISATETQVNVAETPINVSNNLPKESKVNKSKVNYMSVDGVSIVNLTQEEYNALVDMSSRSVVDAYIRKIIGWQKKTGKTLNSPYNSIRDWIVKDGHTKNNYRTSYDLDEWEETAKNIDLESLKFEEDDNESGI